jgi:signal transduction histidine kinase
MAGSAPVEIEGDAARLRRAIRSIVDNALRYSPGKSPVEVSLSRRDGVADLSVADHGFGIPPDERERVFEKFYRGHARAPGQIGGIGVGLFLAREIITLHGGRIWFDSAKDQGTVFHVELPVSARPGHA